MDNSRIIFYDVPVTLKEKILGEVHDGIENRKNKFIEKKREELKELEKEAQRKKLAEVYEARIKLLEKLSAQFDAIKDYEDFHYKKNLTEAKKIYRKINKLVTEHGAFSYPKNLKEIITTPKEVKIFSLYIYELQYCFIADRQAYKYALNKRVKKLETTREDASQIKKEISALRAEISGLEEEIKQKNGLLLAYDKALRVAGLPTL